VSNIRISWNEKAIEQAKAQALEHAFAEVECPDCGTNPRLRQFGRYSCECGKLDGFVTEPG
jgi:hypothetical protein